MKVKAKGKIRREQREEDDQAVAEFEKAQVIPVVSRKELKHEKQSVSSIEIQNVVKDKLVSLFQEFSPNMGDREIDANAEDRATKILRLIKHGIPEGNPARIVEEEQRIPLCRNCR